MASDIDEAQRHAVFFGKIAGIAGIPHQVAEAMEAFPVENIPDDDAQGKYGEEKQVGVWAVGMAEASVDRIASYETSVGRNSHGAVHKIVQEEPKQAEGQSAVKKIVSLMPCHGAGKNGRNHKPQHDAAQKCQQDTGRSHVGPSEGVGIA